MRLKQKPKYEMKLLSNGQTIKFRPFIVEEERNLVMALESGNFDEIILTVRQIVENCTGVDPYKIPYYDLENIFINLRSKSVGEMVDMIGTCDCAEDATTPFQVDLRNIRLEGEVKDPVIKIIDSDHYVSLRQPTAEDIFNSYKMDGVDFIATMIEKHWDDEQVFDDDTIAGKRELLLSMSSEQYEPIDNFYRALPKIQLPYTWHCQHCGESHEVVITGLEDFFV